VDRTQLFQLLAIATGGAVGAVLRFLLSTRVYAWLGRGFPYGTLMVNVLGSFLMGFLTIVLLERSMADPAWRAVILVGFLGAFTTFSTFSIETLNLIDEGEMMRAGLNVSVSVVACLVAAWFGVVVGRQL
jgi:CrcB protein